MPATQKQLDPATQAELAQLMLAIAHNPKTRKQVVKQIKEVFPAYVVPDDVAKDDLLGVVKDEFSERDRKAAEKDAKTRLEQQRKGLIDGTLIEGRRYDDKQVKEIEALMESRGVADYETGALIYAGSEKPAGATPEIPTAGQWQMPKVDNPFDSAKIAASARTKAFDAIREINSRRA